MNQQKEQDKRKLTDGQHKDKGKSIESLRRKDGMQYLPAHGRKSRG